MQGMQGMEELRIADCGLRISKTEAWGRWRRREDFL